MSKLEQVDRVYGHGTGLVMTAGAYPDGEKTRYKFGFNLDFPGFITSMVDGPAKSYAVLGAKRVISVDAAATFNKKNDFGTEQDAEAFLARFTGDAAFITALESKRQPRAATEKLEGPEQKAVKVLTDNYIRLKFPKFDTMTVVEKAEDGTEKTVADKAGKLKVRNEARAWALKEKAGDTKNWKKVLDLVTKAEGIALDV